jgi:two-component system alkaline phosphatase synthesis response regulator PhoP
MYRVLVADDDLVLSKMLEIILTGEGYEVRLAHHGQEAISYITEGWNPHVLILDLLMPIMDGNGVCEWIMNNLSSQKRPAIILLSATLLRSSCPPIISVALAKPCDLSEMLEAIDQLCHSSKSTTSESYVLAS